ncbi:MAG: protein-tyrosine phosphatase [Chloroflexaceae bacterium]|nr:protein-tyrosine phosphatase [Chloroflexaceae bacterium]
MMMIDFHTHILHGIDDGPQSLEGSLQMARVAVADGTRTMVATPHTPGMGNYRAETVLAHLDELREALKQEHIPLEVLPGSEIFYDANLPARLDDGEYLTCNRGRTVLVECPIHDYLPSGFEQMAFDLQLAGYRVVLAHPERITDVQEDPNVLIPMIERGVLMQLTSQALTGEQGPKMQQLAETLVTHRLVHIIASDAHGPTYRPPKLSSAREIAAGLIGAEAAAALVEDNPGDLVHDRMPANLPVPQEVPRKRRWWVL